MTATKSRRKPRKRTTKRARPPVDNGLTEPGNADKLTDELRLIVVQRLAKYDTPQEIADDVKLDYDITISRQGIQSYDPTVGRKPSEKWCAIFDATRKKFLDDTADAAPIALRSVRLRRLDRVCVRAAKAGNGMMVLASTEQAAKEMGELYTNRHKMELSGKDGGPIEVKTDDLRKRIVGRINGVASRLGTHQNNSGADARRAGGA
jgi:hypothetical protein